MPERPRIIRETSFIVPEIRNPFRHDLKFNAWDYIRIALMSVTIAPLRILVTTILLLPAWLLCFIAFLGKKNRDEPLKGWRKSLKRPIIAIARFQMFCMGFHHVKVKGQLAAPSEARILVVAPHTSYYDALVPFMCNLPSAVSRLENEMVPLFGTLVRMLQPVSVSRSDSNSKRNTIDEIKRRAQPGSEWPQIIIFPEGTTTNGSCLITFKGGAFIPGVPVQPISLRYANSPNTFPWTWDGPGLLTVLWLTSCNLSNNMELEFLPVYKPSPEEIANSRLFSNNVRALLARHLDVTVTDHTYEDCCLMEEAKAMGLPCEVGVVEFHKLLSKLGIKLEHLRSHLTKYSEIASTKGYITLEDLAQYLNVPVSPALEDLFNMYDRDGTGKIDFREYIIGCSLVTKPANSEDTVRMAFQMFGGDKGYITSDDLFVILDNAFGMDREETDMLFKEVDTFGVDHITYDSFKAYAEKKPEYAALFTHYMDRPTDEPSQQTDTSSRPVAPASSSPWQHTDDSKKEN